YNIRIFIFDRIKINTQFIYAHYNKKYFSRAFLKNIYTIQTNYLDNFVIDCCLSVYQSAIFAEFISQKIQSLHCKMKVQKSLTNCYLIITYTFFLTFILFAHNLSVDGADIDILNR
ncbi:hypothetical protein L9F63_010430, partial [Diploptera punctata]